MPISETINTKIPKRSKAKNHIPKRNTPSQKNANPIGINDISVSDTGVVQINKGKVYININKEGAAPFFTPIYIRDEFDNLIEVTRNSNEEDISTGTYVNNQSIRSINHQTTRLADGKPSRNVNADSGLNEI